MIAFCSLNKCWHPFRGTDSSMSSVTFSANDVKLSALPAACVQHRACIWLCKLRYAVQLYWDFCCAHRSLHVCETLVIVPMFDRQAYVDRQAKLAVEKADLDAGKESEIGCREGQRLSVKFIAYRQTYRRRASRLGSSTPAPLGSALRATKNQTRALAEGSLSLGTFFGIPCSVRHVTHPTVCILNRLDLVKHCASE